METNDFEEPFEVICGVCAGYMGKSKNRRGEISYDGCEEG